MTDPTVIPAVLGWRNPEDDGLSLRLYARDRGESPRWDRQSSPTGRTIECALVSPDPHAYGLGEGDRYLVIRAGDRFVDEGRLAALVVAVEDLVEQWARSPCSTGA